MIAPTTGPKLVAAPPRMSAAYVKNVTCGWKLLAPTPDCTMASMMPAMPPITPPMISAWILKLYVFLPRLRTASSSSRIDCTTRPHGLRMRR